MTDIEITALRLQQQQISQPQYSSPNELVAYMCAMQAQDFNMGKWAIASRLKDASMAEVERAFNEGKILRTHVMRPTWHFIAAQDYRWMLELTSPQIKTIAKPRAINWGFDEQIFHKSFDVIGKALSNNHHLTREQIMTELIKAGINTDEGRSYHMMLWAELEGIVCSGAVAGKEQTYALLDERVPQNANLTKEEALHKLALAYFTSHAPASLADFVWWSSLKTSDARKAVQSIQSQVSQVKINASEYYFPKDLIPTTNISAYFLPAYDEFVIAYRDRTHLLKPEWNANAISSNGIFKPVIVLNGQVIGIWKRTLKKDSVTIEAQIFTSISKSELRLLEEAAEKYAHYEGKKLLFRINN